MKPFIITIDTEGDNLWLWKKGDQILTENTLYLKRFQNLCEKYNFKPVYLTNYEMIKDKRYVEFINSNLKNGTCEIGMHLHAWNNPPKFELDNSDYKGAPYLIEYTEEVMEKKISILTEEIVKATGVKPISHRAGRWATNMVYFKLLNKYGYKIDCSITPNVSWVKSPGQTVNSCGSDYSGCSEEPYFITDNNKKVIYEVPMTVRKYNKLILPENLSIKGLMRSIKGKISGEAIWLRPTGSNLKKMIYLVDEIKVSNSNYLMFMLHSSELMPGGSPNFKNNKEIEKLYNDLEILFNYISKDFYGCTLKEYYNKFIENKQ